MNRREVPEPTSAGKLMVALSFPVEDAYMILTGGRLALMHEVLAVRAIATHKPMPIIHHFGETRQNYDILSRFHPDVQMNQPTSVLLAHLAAFFYWDRTWNSKRCQAMLEQFSVATSRNMDLDGEDPNVTMSPIDVPSTEMTPYMNGVVSSANPCCDVAKWTVELEAKHTEWCERMEISATAVRGIAELFASSVNVFYRSDFEPAWLRCSQPTPHWHCNGLSCDKEEQDLATLQDLPESTTAMFLNGTYGHSRGKALVGS